MGLTTRRPSFKQKFPHKYENHVFPCTKSYFRHPITYKNNKENFFSAAHCTIAKSFVFIKLGVKDVSSINGPEGIFRISEKVKNHPEYRSQSSHADIAVVKMADPVSFDNTVIIITHK